MGGKKKTKWRKLPLEEFIKEKSKPDKGPPVETCQTDSTEENNFIPSSYEPTEAVQYPPETYEYIDGLWYPTSCIVYNPAEVGLYSSYMMPLDNYYYCYYAMPEMPQMQDYIQMPYTEYTAVLPKDTVYLLLPTQTLRPSQPAQNLVPEWQNRRRRRRYEGYADYAVIPDKTNTTTSEERDEIYSKEQFIKSRKNSAQSNHFKRMTSETCKFTDCNSSTGQNPTSSKSNNVKKNSKLYTDINNVMGSMSINKNEEPILKPSVENNQKTKKSLEMCGVHSKSITEKINPQTVKPTSLSPKDEHSECDINGTNEENAEKKSSELINNISDLSSNNSINKPVLLSNEKFLSDKLKQQSPKTEDSLANEIFHITKVLEHDTEMNKLSCLPANEKNTADRGIYSLENISETKSQSSLPDILCTLSKSLSDENKQESDEFNEILPSAIDHEKEKSSKSFLSQTSYMPNLSSSEALHNEMEMELQQLQSLRSLKTNQSIYKLAYDENVTDQSEADSRSPSPMDPESHVPCSITNSEILIHEADSGSEAGSEDVELLPHRYESETFLHENKHLYINKLSLAVELLRTQESLPYDNEFKRVVGENRSNNVMPVVHTGKVNIGYKESSSSPEICINKHFENKGEIQTISGNEISLYKLKHSANSSNDSAIFSDIDIDNLEEKSCEGAKEAVGRVSEIQDNTEQIRAGYRRFGIQARHYFSPRAFSLNPCLCCIIM